MNGRTVASLRVFLAAVVVLSLVAVPAGAIAQGEPNLSVSVVETDSRLDPGDTTDVRLAIQNRGEVRFSRDAQLDDKVTTARGVTVSASAARRNVPIEVRTGEQAIGSIRDGEASQVPIRVVVDEDAKQGTYTINVRLRYSYYSTYENGRTITQRTITRTRNVDVEVRERPRFDVEVADADVAIGDSGPVAVEVTNVGDSTAENAVLELTSENPGSAENPLLTLDGSERARTSLGDLEPGERRNVTVEGAVAADVQRRNYSIAAAIDYEDEDGIETRSDGHTIGIFPDPERAFAVENVQSELRVDEERTLSGSLRNDGAVAVDNVVLRLETTNPNIDVREPEIALGSLEPDERASFSFDVDVSDNAKPGDRQFTLTAEYRTQAGDRRTSDPLDARVSIEEQRPTFEVTGVDARFTAGSGGVLAVEIRNARDEPVRDISAKLYTEDPLSSSDDEAFVQQLDPGGTAEISFRLQVGGSAIQKAYPAQVDFQYDDAEGDTHITDTYQVPVEVIEPESEGPPVVPIVIVVLLVLAIGGYLLYRRR